MKGQDLYTTFKKNNTSVIIMGVITIISVVGALVFGYIVYGMSINGAYAMNDKGEIIPLRLLEQKEADEIQARANVEYFVEQYYSLDAYSMKKKRERVLWLVGEKPTEIIKDRISKGYFDEFMSVAGLIQNAEVLHNTLKISKEAPYEVSCIVRIQRVNGGVSTYYNNHITMKMEKVNRNYPYNPYGLLITQFSENLQRIDVKSKEAEEEIQNSEEAINQNPKTDGTE